MEYQNYKVELHPCGDCAALPGYEHTPGCDVARCPLCGRQRIGCNEHDSKKPSIWTGIWPGEVECAEFNMWSKWVEGSGWVETTADDPERSPNLNRLNMGSSPDGPLAWSVRLQRFVRWDHAKREELDLRI